MRTLRRLVVAGAVIALTAMAALLWALDRRPDIAAYGDLTLSSSVPEDKDVQVTLVGVSTMLISDGQTAIMTDGFFTRPSLLKTATMRIAPDEAAIDAGLARLGVTELDAVIVVHSHYDHVMDAPIVARKTGAVVIGSASTAAVAQGLAFPEERMRVAASGAQYSFGSFTVELRESRHFPHGMAMGEITEPLVPPARATEYLEGGSYSVIVRHPAGTLLIQGSAGFIDGMLDDVRADVVLLGVGGLGSKDEAYRDAYWRAVVAPLDAALVIPIHWDDFTIGLDEPLVPMPSLLDDLDATMAYLRRRAGGVDGPMLGWLPTGRPYGLLPDPVTLLGEADEAQEFAR